MSEIEGQIVGTSNNKLTAFPIVKNIEFLAAAVAIPNMFADGGPAKLQQGNAIGNWDKKLVMQSNFDSV